MQDKARSDKPPRTRALRVDPEKNAHSLPSGERLQKVLAAAGVASRRAAEELIDAGRVRVDGAVVAVQGMRVDPTVARIEVDGVRVSVELLHSYFMLNKPVGVVTTVSDPQGRPVAVDFVRGSERIYPVGRLDIDTTGLLLLTNHGELAHRLTHPRYQLPRTYFAELRGVISTEAVDRLRSGIPLDDGVATAKSVHVRRTGAGRSHVEIVMGEGRKREVRRMMDSVGYPVVQLVRTAFGPVVLGDLGVGKTRPLSPQEVGTLLQSVGL